MARQSDIQQAVTRHAMGDMSQIPGAPQDGAAAAERSGLAGRFMNWVRSNHQKMPSLVGQAEAVIREAAKDIRQTLEEVFFNKAEHAPEMGTPQNPTPQNVTQDLGNFRGYDPDPVRYDPEANLRPGPAQERNRGRGR
jgi:hypothetical protein